MIGIVLVAIGVVMVAAPHTWIRFQRWQYRLTFRSPAPADWHSNVTVHRLWGSALLVAGALFLIFTR